MGRWIVLIALAGACAHCDGKSSATDGGPDAAGDTDVDSDSDADSDTDADSDADPGSCVGEPEACENIAWAWCEGQIGCHLETDCLGDPVPCGEVTGGLDCYLMLGCDWDGDCTGSATPCNNFYDAVQCAGQLGCTWSWGDESCYGAATSCWVLDPSDCASQQGCNLVGGNCTGSSFPCDGLDGTQCSFQLGCEVLDTCLGTPLACEQITDAYACFQQIGCSWSYGEEDAGSPPDGGDPDDAGPDGG